MSLTLSNEYQKELEKVNEFLNKHKAYDKALTTFRFITRYNDNWSDIESLFTQEEWEQVIEVMGKIVEPKLRKLNAELNSYKIKYEEFVTSELVWEQLLNEGWTDPETIKVEKENENE